MLCSRLKIPVFARLCSFTLVFDDLHAITYHPEGCFMQNKPNFRTSEIGVSSIITMNYNDFIPLAGRKNKPNQTQFKANTNPILGQYQGCKANSNPNKPNQSQS